MDIPTLKNLEDEEQQKKNIPEPPPLEISVRTMESDTKSFKQGGGEISQTPNIQPNQAQPEIPGYQGSERSIFSRSIDISPEQLAFRQGLQARQPEQSKSGIGKTVAIVVGVLIGAIALGFLGYYIIFPLIFK